MHPGRCAGFREVAQAEIRDHVQAIAQALDLDVAAIPMAVNVKQPDVAALEMEQATAAMLKQVRGALLDDAPAAKAKADTSNRGKKQDR